MDKVKVALIPLAFFLLPVAANAYVGPGAGLSLLGALWALVAAIATALIFVVVWPIRRMRRRRREAQAAQSAEPVPEPRSDRGVGESGDVGAQDAAVTRLRTSADDEEDRLQPQ